MKNFHAAHETEGADRTRGPGLIVAHEELLGFEDDSPTRQAYDTASKEARLFTRMIFWRPLRRDDEFSHEVGVAPEVRELGVLVLGECGMVVLRIDLSYDEWSPDLQSSIGDPEDQ